MGGELFNDSSCVENVTEGTLRGFRGYYGCDRIKKLDIFYYVYGLLHSPEYKSRYEADLKKMLPHIPMHKDFWAFSTAGRELGKLHVNYEDVEEYPLDEVFTDLGLSGRYGKVIKMRFGKDGSNTEDRTKIIYNSQLTLKGIPLECYKYIVNGKSAIEWIMERYQVKVDRDSKIKNDPNDWSDNSEYIVSLLKKIITVSVKTMQIVDELPKLQEN